MHSSDDVAARRVREAFKEQADWCAKHGSSPFTAFLCSLLGERLDWRSQGTGGRACLARVRRSARSRPLKQ